MSGKGSNPRPFSVTQEKFSENWDRIFGKDEAKERNNYQDILSTEDCILNVLENDISNINNTPNASDTSAPFGVTLRN